MRQKIGFGLIAAATLMLMTGSVTAQITSGAPGGAAAAGPHLGRSMPEQKNLPDEHLSMPLFPKGWVRTTAQSGSIEVFEFIPANQTPTTWTDKIYLEVHHDTNTLPLDAYQGRALGQVRENCDGILEGKLQTGVNNGFPAAYWMLGCKRDKRGNFGELRYTKAVQGGSTLYLLSRSWRTPIYGDEGPPLPPQVAQEAKDFLGSSVVCASTGQHPCPPGDSAPQP